MVKIRTTTQIDAPMERCFRLSLSVALQREAAGEFAVPARTAGLLRPGDRMRWHSGLFGWGPSLETVLEAWRAPLYFREVEAAGAPGRFEHDHHFAPMNDGTRIRDEIRFSAPTGWMGRLAERFILPQRANEYLKRRNALIKRIAESDDWHRYLEGEVNLEPIESTGIAASGIEAVRVVPQPKRQQRAGGLNLRAESFPDSANVRL